MKMRPYQDEAVVCILDEFTRVDNTLAVMATGCGKTVTFAELIRHMFPRRVLVLAHRKELIFQAEEKIKRITGFSTGVEMGDFRLMETGNLFGNSHVVISSIQSQIAGYDGKGRMSKFNPHNFGLVIIDEAHHATSQSYKRVIDYYRQNPNIKMLGVTATPDRADNEALGQIYDSVAFEYGIQPAIRDGWLVPIKQQMIEVDGLDFSKVHTTAGDLNGGELSRIMEFEENLHAIASPTMEIVGNRQTIVFTASVAQAERLSEIFNRHKPYCSAWVCGKTDPEKRDEILGKFSSGQTQIVCNCGILTEGYDNPNIEVIIMGRPTKSRSLYTQMIGRGLRPEDGILNDIETPEGRKQAILNSNIKECLVVDFVGNAGRHKLISSADILGGKVSDDAIERAVINARKSGRPVDMEEELLLAEEELKKEQEEERKRKEAERLRLRVKANWKSRKINPFDIWDIKPATEKSYDKGKRLSSKQIALLEKNGIAKPEDIPYRQAKQIIDEMFKRWDNNECSLKQAKILKQYDLPVNVSVSTAIELIDAIANNGWQRPADIESILLKDIPF